MIVPPKLKEPILEVLHVGHPGIVRMEVLATSYIWWPNMDRDIAEWVATYNQCQESRPAPHSAPVHEWETSRALWSRVHIDFGEPFYGQTFMVLMDAYSKWLEIILMPSTTAEAVIKVLRRLFSTHGLPDVLVSDNVPQFMATQFELFLAKRGIYHALVPPFHPNGQAETMVQSTKEVLS